MTPIEQWIWVRQKCINIRLEIDHGTLEKLAETNKPTRMEQKPINKLPNLSRKHLLNKMCKKKIAKQNKGIENNERHRSLSNPSAIPRPIFVTVRVFI